MNAEQLLALCGQVIAFERSGRVIEARVIGIAHVTIDDNGTVNARIDYEYVTAAGAWERWYCQPAQVIAVRS